MIARTDRLRILALIAARGGSKRLPGKNIRQLGGKPLIVWSIDIAKNIPEVCDILVSTDASDIAEISRRAGALVPWLRPAELSSDTASSVDASLHALDWYEAERGAVDGLLLLQPTSPFRRRETILRAIDLFGKEQRRSVLGVSPAQSHPMWCVQIDGTSMRPFVEGGGMNARSQDLPKAYAPNGALYLIDPNELRAQRSFCNDATAPLIIDEPSESIDIDTEWDWALAEAHLAIGHGSSEAK
jgi:CMP-N,N'-diacetyllegionaminic acid synthase